MADEGQLRHRLCFGEIEVGEVAQEGADFPSTSGRWTPAVIPNPSSVRAHIQEYIEYSIEAGRLMDATGGGPEWEAFVTSHEDEFLDLIESEDWWLISPTGVRSRIVIPNFLPNGEVVWRYEFSAS